MGRTLLPVSIKEKLPDLVTISFVMLIALLTIVIITVDSENVDADNVDLTATVYSHGDDGYYALEGDNSSRTGKTQFKGKLSSDSTISCGDIDGISAYTSPTAIRFTLIHEIKDVNDSLGNKYYLSSDSAQCINYEKIGKLKSGGMLVQTSSRVNGNWETIGYYTDVFSSVNDQYFILKSSDVSSGTYVRVMVGYEIYKKAGLFELFNDYYNELNVFEFYIGPSVDVLTINNLTVTNGSIPTGEYASENMSDGSMSTTGIFINKSLGTGVSIEVSLNGEPLDVKTYYISDKYGYEFVESGKYLIKLIDSSRIIEKTIYIDRSTPDEAFDKYFSKNVVDYAYINIKAVKSNEVPLGGKIVNEDTNDVIDVPYDRSSKNYYLKDGTYSCVFKTGADTVNSGDQRIWEVNFTLKDRNVQKMEINSVADESTYSYDTDPIDVTVKYICTDQGLMTIIIATLIIGLIAYIILRRH